MNKEDMKGLNINSGIKQLVLWLNKNGFKTVDSGDGETHDFDCDRDEPYVVILVEPKNLITEAKLLLGALNRTGIKIGSVGGDLPSIQATYCPVDEYACLDLIGVSDKDLLHG